MSHDFQEIVHRRLLLARGVAGEREVEAGLEIVRALGDTRLQRGGLAGTLATLECEVEGGTRARDLGVLGRLRRQ